MVIWTIKIFLYSSVFSWHLFISYASVRSLPFLSFIVPILAWNIPLISPIFLKRYLSLSHSIVFLYFFIVHWRKPYLFFLFCVTLHSVDYICPLLLCLALFFPSAICKASSDNHFAFLHYFFFGIILVIASCTVLWNSVHWSSGNPVLPCLIPWIYSSPPLYNLRDLI